jgi:hypothetical protein
MMVCLISYLFISYFSYEKDVIIRGLLVIR